MEATFWLSDSRFGRYFRIVCCFTCFERSKMLVLSRKIGEVIVIGDEIRVTILEIRPMAVRIGIDAPKNISVHRQEVWIQINDSKS